MRIEPQFTCCCGLQVDVYICRARFYPFLAEVSMAWSLGLVGGCVILLALLAVYVPTIYIRKTNKLIELLEKIEANTRK